MGITSLVNLLHFVPPCLDCDVYDKINYKYSSYFLLALGLMFFAREYFGNPIDCWQKAGWNNMGSWLQYAKDYCLVEGTYFIPLNEEYHKLQPHEDMTAYNKYRKINYYQWLPFTFCFLGLLFTFPKKYWDIINWTSTLHMSSILNHVTKKHLQNPREFAKTVSCHIRDILKRRRQHHNPLVRFIHQLFSNCYLTANHLFLKVLNFLNSIIVFYALTYFVADDANNPFGFTIFMNLIKGVNWKESQIFPRVTTCIFEIKKMSAGQLGSFTNIKTVPCVLNANMLTEFFYMVSYIVLLCVIVLNIYSFFYSCYQMTSTSRINFVKKLLVDSVDFVWLPPNMDPKHISEMESEAREYHKREVALDKVKNCEKFEVKEKALIEFEKIIRENDAKEKSRKEKRDNKRGQYLNNIDKHIYFFVDYLGEDSVLLLRLLMSNSAPSVAGALAGRLFWKYCKDIEEIQFHHDLNNNNNNKYHNKYQ